MNLADVRRARDDRGLTARLPLPRSFRASTQPELLVRPSRLAVLALSIVSPLRLAAQRTDAPPAHSFTGVPALNFDADEGFGYGGVLQYHDYGAGAERPYRYMLQPAVLFTTRGRRDAVLFADAPHLLAGGWRLTALVAREQQLATPFYGLGNDTDADPAMVSSSNPYFYRYGRTVLRANVDVQHALGHPALRGVAGVGVRHVDLRAVPYDRGTTLLAQTLGNAPAALSSHSARVGLVWDTRDREIGPTRGSWIEVLAQAVSSPAAGYGAYTRLTTTARHYAPLSHALTFAQRVVVQNVHGDAPVTELSLLQSSYRDDEGLGGASTLRGIPQNRYQGKGIALANAELRWEALRGEVHGTPARLIVTGFADAGRVWESGIRISELATALHASGGAGMRVGLGPSFIAGADVGHSAQSAAATYVVLGYAF